MVEAAADLAEGREQAGVVAPAGRAQEVEALVALVAPADVR